MNKKKNVLIHIIGLLVMTFVLLSTLQAGTTLAANKGILEVTPSEATILMGSTQKFEALFTNESLAPFDYALFSGSSTDTLALTGSMININGNVHSNKNFTAYGGSISIRGTVEAVKTVSVGAGSTEIGSIVENAPFIDMPDFSDTIKTQAEAAGQLFIGDQMFNGSTINVDSPIYVEGDLKINGSQISGNGTIVATGDITFSGSSISFVNDASVCFYSKNGNINMHSSVATLKGMVYAPNGTIFMTGSNQTIYGRVIGKKVQIHCSTLNIISSDNDLESLPPSGATPITPIWSSSDPSVATINASGLATSIGPGTSIITAEYTVDNVLYTDTAQLTVVNFQITPPDKNVSLGFTQQYKAILIDSNGTVTDITHLVNQWSTYSYGLGSATINQSGLATAVRLGGFCLIKATYIVNGVSLTASTTINIVMPVLSIIPNSKILLLGSERQYSTILTNIEGDIQPVTTSVTWASNNSDIATVEPLTGIATGVGVGTCDIVGTYIISGTSIEDTMPLKIVNLSLSPSRTTLKVDETQQYEATLTNYDGKIDDVTTSVNWSSDNANVASIDPETGIATGVGVGTCTIIGTYNIDGEDIIVTTPLDIVNLIITPARTTIILGMTQQFKAEFTDIDGKTTDLTNLEPQSSEFSWSSNNANVASIHPETGIATGIGVGTCDIAGTYIINGVSIKAETPLKIVDLSLTPSNTTLRVGDTQQYNATLTDYNSESENVTTSVTWSSDNANVASMDPETGIATGVGVGTCTIKGIYIMNGQSIAVTADLTVKDKEVTELNITPPINVIFVGYNQQFNLTYSDGTISESLTNSASWDSSEPSVAKINSGLATGKKAGITLISVTANINGKSQTKSFLLTVLPPEGGVIRSWEQYEVKEKN